MNEKLTTIERYEARRQRQTAELDHLLDVAVMHQVTARHYTVSEATPADWVAATKNPRWRAAVDALRLGRARRISNLERLMKIKAKQMTPAEMRYE